MFHSYPGAKSRHESSIHHFMTQPGYNADDEPLPSFIDDHEEDPGLVPKSGTKVLLLDGVATPSDNTNNSAVGGNQVQTIASHADSPLQSLETSVWTSILWFPPLLSLFLFSSIPPMRWWWDFVTTVSDAPKCVRTPTWPWRNKNTDRRGFGQTLGREQ